MPVEEENPHPPESDAIHAALLSDMATHRVREGKYYGIALGSVFLPIVGVSISDPSSSLCLMPAAIGLFGTSSHAPEMKIHNLTDYRVCNKYFLLNPLP